MADLRQATQQALGFTMRDFASGRDFDAARAVLQDTLRAALAQEEQEPVVVPPPPKLTYTGGWWAITGARLIVETRHPVGYTTHRELANDERQKWADWFKALKEAQ